MAIMSSPSKYHRTEVLLAFGEPHPDTVYWLHAEVAKVVA